MIINLNIDTREDLSDNDKVVLLALAGEISLGEPRERPDYPVATAHTPSPEGLAAIERDIEASAPQPTLDAIAEAAEEVSEAAEEKPTRARVVNVSEASLKKYGFTMDGDQVTCETCGFISETGRALHLHAGTHKDEAPAQEKGLKAVPEPKEEPEAGVSAFTSTEPDKQDVADAEKAAAGDPDPEPIAEVPEPVEAKVVDPKVLRDEVAKVATEMVAAQRQSDIRSVLDDLGVARVSMIDEKDLQTFLDAEPIAAFIASKKG